MATSAVEPHDFGLTGRGLRTTRAVSAGEELLAVPLDECWHGESARASAVLVPVVRCGAELSDTDAVALQLLAERRRGATSMRAAHLAELPATSDATLFWSAAELDELRGSAWHELAAAFGAAADADWEALCAQPGIVQLLAEHGVERADYLWAVTMVKSRSYEAVVDGKVVRLLAPRFDLFNHDDGGATGVAHDFDDARQVLVARATRDLAAGEQAFTAYGTHRCNGSLLVGGGFAVEPNGWDHVEVCLTVERCDARRLPILMMSAPDAPTTLEVMAQFEFLKVPEDDALADGAMAPFVSKHLLTLACPLPAALLAYVRLERLSDADLGTQLEKADKAGVLHHDHFRSPLEPPLLELLALGALRSVLQQKVEAYPTTLDADESELAAPDHPSRQGYTHGGADDAAATTARRRQLALLVRLGEKRVLAAALRELDGRIRPLVKALVGGAASQAKACARAGQSWASLVARRQSVLTAQGERVSVAFERLRACSLGDGDETSALLCQTAAALIHLLAGVGSHPLAAAAAFVPDASPFEAAEAPPAPFALPALSPLALAAPPPGLDAPALAYLSLYVEKMRLWGAYLAGQWGVAKALSTSDASTMNAEAVAIRNAHAWSVPTAAALDALAARAPLVEVGAGNGLWARELWRRGVDLVAYDTKQFSRDYGDGTDGALMGDRDDGVVEGGPERAAAHPERTLVLMWPDYEGRGGYGLACIEAYIRAGGERLVLVGEWRGATFGACTEGIGDHGQSFSAEVQAAVEGAFEVEEVVRLPNWPLFLDVCVAWRRRPS